MILAKNINYLFNKSEYSLKTINIKKKTKQKKQK